MHCAEWVQCFGLQRIWDAEAHLSRYLFGLSLLAPSYGYTIDKQNLLGIFVQTLSLWLQIYMHMLMISFCLNQANSLVKFVTLICT